MELSMEEKLKRRIALLRETAPGSIGDQMDYTVESCDEEAGEYVLRCKTFPWMRNLHGTLHGGMCATVVDQAMGFAAWCLMPGPGNAPTVQMNVNYHRPLIPGEDVLIRIQKVAVSKSLISLSCQASLVSSPERICMTSTATYFYKPQK